ncbi:MAG: hypothetical protein KKE73_09425 [Proteobacteria bacterium]|nr:hypothetical protein [Pseudomonadota bacterium]
MQTALRHANTVLTDRFETMAQTRGRPEAVVDIKQIVTLGVDIILERAQGRALNAAQNIVVSAIHSGRVDLLVEEIAADVQDLSKARNQKYLLEVPTRHGSLTFLPDVLIPADEATIHRWQGFLDSLNAFSLRGEDPVTLLRGRIPFREKVWLGDLVFAPGPSVTVIQDIQEVRGNLMLRSHTLAIKHQLSLQGSLYIDADQLGNSPSCIKALKGYLRIYSERIKSVDDLNVSAEILREWGVTQGTLIFINDRRAYRFLEEEGPDGLKLALVESPGGQDLDIRSLRYLWNGTSWAQFHRKLPPDIAYLLLRQFRHVCALLGLGEDFIIRERDADLSVEANTERIVALLDLVQGCHSTKAAEQFPEEIRQLVETIRGHLLRLKTLALGEKQEFYRDMSQVSEDIKETLDKLSDSKLTQIAQAIGNHCWRIDRRGLKSDSDYLKILEGGGLDFGHVLGTAGRAVVFVNNLCRSRPMRARAAEAIADIRRDLKEILGRTAEQNLLLNLLKFPDHETIQQLSMKYPGRKRFVEDLTKHLELLNQKPPLELLQDFATRPFKTVTPELDVDRALLRRVLSLGKGTLDNIFSSDIPGYGTQHGQLLMLALAVNMRSFLTEELKGLSMDTDLELPSVLVARIQHKVGRFRGVIPVFNRLCIHPESTTPA